MSENDTEPPIIPSVEPTPRRWQLSSAWILACRVVGIVGVVHETFFTSGERPVLLIIFGALLGLPTFANLDLGAILDRWRSK